MNEEHRYTVNVRYEVWAKNAQAAANTTYNGEVKSLSVTPDNEHRTVAPEDDQ